MSSTTPAPSWALLRAHEARVRALLDDPQVTGDLLLVGLAIARWGDGLIHLDPSPDGTYSWNHVLGGFLGDQRHHHREPRTPWSIAWPALRDDVRRYQPPPPGYGQPCEAPMIRRDGPCGQSSGTQQRLAHPETGETFYRYACSRHREWLLAACRDHRAAHPTPPVPCANTGGHLARHFPGIDWPEVYRELVPGWTPPPEARPAPARPRLRLIITTQEVPGGH